MSVNLYFQWLHLNNFLKNYGDLSEKRGEFFHQPIRIIEEHYLARWDVNFYADYCWYLKRNTVANKHERKSLKGLFIHQELSCVHFSVHFGTIWTFW